MRLYRILLHHLTTKPLTSEVGGTKGNMNWRKEINIMNKIVRTKTKWQLANEIMDLKSKLHSLRVSTGIKISKLKQEMEV